MTVYATYTYYTNTYLGNAIASADFARLALRASAVIDRITYDRAADVITANTPTATVTAIQMATCAVAEELQTQELSGNIDGVTSESVGSHSVSYGAQSRAGLSNLAKQAEAAKTYLCNTELLYRGFTDEE